jgi:hypothetical protein
MRRAGLAVLAILGYVAVVAVLVWAGKYVHLTTMEPARGSLNAASQELLGKSQGTDFLADYPSAHAVVHGGKPYDLVAHTSAAVGMPWLVPSANTHPPTLLALVVPFTIVRYHIALAAWSMAMLITTLATVRLMEVRWLFAVPAALLVALTFPGAYGIGNPEPLVALGAVVAYRWRNAPWIAGIGLALAAAPKLSGLLLLLPFLLTRRIKAVLYAALLLGGLLALVSVFEPSTVHAYLTSGAEAIKANMNRSDNASLLSLGKSWGVPSPVTIAILCGATLVLAVLQRDPYWPVVWLMVAALPIAWMYSALTLLPLVVVVVKRRSWPSLIATCGAVGLTLTTPPLGTEAVTRFPIIVGLVWVAYAISPRTTEVTTAFRSKEPGRCIYTEAQPVPSSTNLGDIPEVPVTARILQTLEPQFGEADSKM